MKDINKYLAEGYFYNSGLKQLVTHLDQHHGINGRIGHAYISHSDSLSKGGRLRSGSNITNGRSHLVLDLITMTGNSFIDHFKTNQLTADAGILLFLKNIFSGKILGEFGDPSQSCFQG